MRGEPPTLNRRDKTVSLIVIMKSFVDQSTQRYPLHLGKLLRKGITNMKVMRIEITVKYSLYQQYVKSEHKTEHGVSKWSHKPS